MHVVSCVFTAAAFYIGSLIRGLKGKGKASGFQDHMLCRRESHYESKRLRVEYYVYFLYEFILLPVEEGRHGEKASLIIIHVLRIITRTCRTEKVRRCTRERMEWKRRKRVSLLRLPFLYILSSSPTIFTTSSYSFQPYFSRSFFCFSSSININAAFSSWSMHQKLGVNWMFLSSLLRTVHVHVHAQEPEPRRQSRQRRSESRAGLGFPFCHFPFFPRAMPSCWSAIAKNFTRSAYHSVILTFFILFLWVLSHFLPSATSFFLVLC